MYNRSGNPSTKICDLVSITLFGVLLTTHSSVVGEHHSSSVPTPSARISLIRTDSTTNNNHALVRTITDKVNHEVILTSPTGGGQAYLFECNASYPLEWIYYGEGAPTTNADVGRTFKDFYNVNTYTYQAILSLQVLHELQSGRYVCRGSSPEQERLQVHYDLFVPGNGTHILIANAEKKVFVPESKLLTSLPCEVTDPSITLNLYRGNDWGAFHKVELNESIIFRPRKGFILRLHELYNPFGTYMCVTPDNKQRRKVVLIPEKFRSKYETSASSSNPPATVVNNANAPVHLSFDYEHARMLCCSPGSETAPRLQWTACGSVLDCKIKSVCFEEDRCDDKNAPWADPGLLPMGCAGRKLHDGDFGMFKCSTPASSQYQPYLYNRGRLFVDFESAPPSEAILTLTRLSPEPTYLGSEVQYQCNSTRFYFAYGIRWAFKRGNDEIEFIHDSSSYIVSDRYSPSSHIRETKFMILQPDIKAVICFVPIASSPTEWRTVSLPISIKDTFHAYPQVKPPVHPHLNLDYLTNRIPFSSASQPHPILVQPSSRPGGQFSGVDPTPSVDIDDIMSLGGRPYHQHHHHQSEAILPPPHPTRLLAPDMNKEREYLLSSYQHRTHNSFERFSPPPQVSVNPKPEIITLEDLRHLQTNSNQRPLLQHDLQEANMRHRQKYNTKVVVSEARNNSFVVDPEDSKPSPYDKSHLAPRPLTTASSPPPAPPYSEDEGHKSYGPSTYYRNPVSQPNAESSAPKEFQVQSQFSFGPSQSLSEKHKGHYYDESLSPPETHHHHHVESRPSKPRPPPQPSSSGSQYNPYASNKYEPQQQHQQPVGRERNSDPPTRPRPPQQVVQKPVIHFDSKEQQYSLRHPLITTGSLSPHSQQYPKQPMAHHSGESSSSGEERLPPQSWSKLPTYAPTKHSSSSKYHHHHHPMEDLPEIPVMLADAPTTTSTSSFVPAPEDYYVTSLKAKSRDRARSKPKTSSSSSKSKKRPPPPKYDPEAYAVSTFDIPYEDDSSSAYSSKDALLDSYPPPKSHHHYPSQNEEVTYEEGPPSGSTTYYGPPSYIETKLRRGGGGHNRRLPEEEEDHHYHHQHHHGEFEH